MFVSIKKDLNTTDISYYLYVDSSMYIIEKQAYSSGVLSKTFFRGNGAYATNWNGRTSLTYDYDINENLINTFDVSPVLGGAVNCFDDNAVKAGATINVEDAPLLWIEDDYYLTYKDNTFVLNGSGCVFAGDEVDYAAVTEIDLNTKGLSTLFTSKLLGKFTKLEDLFIEINNINLIDISKNAEITRATLQINGLSNIIFDGSVNTKLRNFNLAVNSLTGVIDLTGLNILETFFMHYNSITDVILPSADGNKINFINVSFNQLTNLDLSNSPLLNTIYTQNNQLTAATNSQMLIDLDGHGLNNGIFQGSIFGGGTLTSAGLTAKSNLQAKGWNIVGI